MFQQTSSVSTAGHRIGGDPAAHAIRHSGNTGSQPDEDPKASLSCVYLSGRVLAAQR